jgi:hypothetical protein
MSVAPYARLWMCCRCGLFDVIDAAPAAHPSLAHRLASLTSELLAVSAPKQMLPERERLRLHRLANLANRAIELRPKVDLAQKETSLALAYAMSPLDST